MAGATLLTADDEVVERPSDCETLRVELLVEPLLTERLELLPLTLRLELLPVLLPTERLELVPATLRLELELLLPTLRLDADTLRLKEVPATLLSGVALVVTDLEATELEPELTLRLLLEPNAAVLPDTVRLRFLSQPPPFTLRLGV